MLRRGPERDWERESTMGVKIVVYVYVLKMQFPTHTNHSCHCECGSYTGKLFLLCVGHRERERSFKRKPQKSFCIYVCKVCVEVDCYLHTCVRCSRPEQFSHDCVLFCVRFQQFPARIFSDLFRFSVIKFIGLRVLFLKWLTTMTLNDKMEFAR